MLKPVLKHTLFFVPRLHILYTPRLPLILHLNSLHASLGHATIMHYRCATLLGLASSSSMRRARLKREKVAEIFVTQSAPPLSLLPSVESFFLTSFPNLLLFFLFMSFSLRTFSHAGTLASSRFVGLRRVSRGTPRFLSLDLDTRNFNISLRRQPLPPFYYTTTHYRYDHCYESVASSVTKITLLLLLLQPPQQ